MRSMGWLFFVMLAGCARLLPTVEYRAIGKFDPREETQSAEMMRQTMRTPDPEANVAVLLDQMPVGIHENGPGLLAVETGYQHEILGRATVRGRKGTFYFLARFLEYRDEWRRALCYWQVPLEWITLGFWSLVPTSYACHASGTPLTREEAIEDLRKAASAVNADLVFIQSPKTLKNDEVKEMTAWMIRLDPRVRGGAVPEQAPTEPPPPPPPLPSP